jgi:aspartate racemase
MKTIGLLGGMSWLSTIPYYRIINETVNTELGALHSARLLLYSVDFEEIETLQQAGRWDDAGVALADAARALERAGADFIVLCTNTMHRIADAIEDAVAIPLLHIADATADAIRAAGHSRVGLLGTRYTMEEPFYKDRLEQRHALEVLTPDPSDRELIHRVIYDELCAGLIRSESRAAFAAIAGRLVARGAQGIVLGCTEIGLLLGRADVPAPLFDTARIHAEAAARLSLPGRRKIGD